MKKIVKLVIILAMFFSIMNINKYIYAAPVKDAYGKETQKTDVITEEKSEKLSDILKQADDFLKRGKVAESDSESKVEINVDTKQLKKSLADIFNKLSTIGIILSVVVGGFLGIKFMMESAEDKAKIKEAMIPYVLGCVVIFAASAIWKLVATMLSSVF